jgi:BASS family bile acid:Na+ symporter
LVLVASILVGTLLPATGAIFQPHLKYFIMGLLFLSFLGIRISEIWLVLHQAWLRIAVLSVLKIIVLPVAVYFVFAALGSPFAMGALLLTGVSTGVVAPFISNLVGGNTPLVLAVVVFTSLATPFSLPALVDILAGRSFDLPLKNMVIMLSEVIFIPLITVEALRRILPGFVAGLHRRGYPLSLTLFAVINLGVFSRYADFFRQQPTVIINAVVVAMLLGLIYLVVGLASSWNSAAGDSLASAVSLSNVNNVLVIVFASQFFGPLESTLAAMYMFPFFAVIIPLRLFKNWKDRSILAPGKG